MRSGTDHVQKLLGRIRFRRRLRAVVQHSGTITAIAISAMALLILLDRLVSVTFSDQVLYGLPTALLLVAVIVAYLSVRNTPVSEAVEAEKSERIPQTISTSLFAEQSEFGTEAADKITFDAQQLAGKVDSRRAIPLGMPGNVMKAVYALALLLVVTTLPRFDLLGVEEQAVKKQREQDRVVRKEGALHRRMSEISRIAQQHRIDPETRNLLAKLAKKPPELPAGKPSDRATESKSAQERTRKARRDVASRLDRSALEAARNTADRVRQSAERSGEPRSDEARELQQALRKGDLGRAALELQKLAEQAAQEGQAGDQAREDLSRLAESLGLPDDLASKFARKSGDGSSGSAADPDDLKRLAQQLDQLARLLRESDLLDHALDQIQFTEAELSSLPSEWPDGPPPQICPDCLAGT